MKTDLPDSRGTYGAHPPNAPRSVPLDWKKLAGDFSACVMDPANNVRFTDPNGNPAFTSFLEDGRHLGMNHELVAYGPIFLGSLMLGRDCRPLLPTLPSYFNREAGIFVNVPGQSKVELWYLVYVNALAAHIIHMTRKCRSLFESGGDELPDMWRSSADRLREMARRLDYDFHHQGYDFTEHEPWTRKDIYRQEDTVGGYAYLMLLAHRQFGDREYLDEAVTAMERYLSFSRNPWYEVPSGALALTAAAALNGMGYGFDLRKALGFLLDPSACLVSGTWGDREVSGLMRGWRHSQPESAYSLESLVVLPHILPAVRYDVGLAEPVGRYALNAASSVRSFFSGFMDGLESRADLSAAVAYERLYRTCDGKSPFAAGDFWGHKSIYGGAYVLWWAALVEGTDVPYVLRLDLTRTDFLDPAAYPTFLFFNPWDQEKEIHLGLAGKGRRIYSLMSHDTLPRELASEGKTFLPPGAVQVVAVLPEGGVERRENKRLLVDGVVVDYEAQGGGKNEEQQRSSAFDGQKGSGLCD